MVDLTSSLYNANINLFYLINGINNPVLNNILPVIASYGSTSLIILLILAYIFGGNYGRRVTILGVLAVILATVVVLILKYIFVEQGPSIALSHVNLLIPVMASVPTFPSGQTASSFAAATVMGLKYSSKWRGVIYLILIYASLIGFSLVYSGVHYPFDVICGAIIGIISALIILKYQKRILNNKIASIIALKRD